MTTREYLEQLKDIDGDIINISNQAQKWIDLATRMGHAPNGDRVDSSPVIDKMENAVIKAIECTEKAGKEAERLINLKIQIEDQIRGMVKDGERGRAYYYILWGTYHDKKTLAEISVNVGYSYSQTKRLLKKGIVSFEKKYGNAYLNDTK